MDLVDMANGVESRQPNSNEPEDCLPIHFGRRKPDGDCPLDNKPQHHTLLDTDRDISNQYRLCRLHNHHRRDIHSFGIRQYLLDRRLIRLGIDTNSGHLR